jgi:hypothetical protein
VLFRWRRRLACCWRALGGAPVVGNNVQTEAWLDEALVSYSQIVYQEGVNGPEAAEHELEGSATATARCW